LGYCLE